MDYETPIPADSAFRGGPVRLSGRTHGASGFHGRRPRGSGLPGVPQRRSPAADRERFPDAGGKRGWPLRGLGAHPRRNLSDRAYLAEADGGSDGDWRSGGQPSDREELGDRRGACARRGRCDHRRAGQLGLPGQPEPADQERARPATEPDLLLHRRHADRRAAG